MATELTDERPLSEVGLERLIAQQAATIVAPERMRVRMESRPAPCGRELAL